jgi:hypothetical protein
METYEKTVDINKVGLASLIWNTIIKDYSRHKGFNVFPRQMGVFPTLNSEYMEIPMPYPVFSKIPKTIKEMNKLYHIEQNDPDSHIESPFQNQSTIIIDLCKDNINLSISLGDQIWFNPMTSKMEFAKKQILPRNIPLLQFYNPDNRNYDPLNLFINNLPYTDISKNPLDWLNSENASKFEQNLILLNRFNEDGFRKAQFLFNLANIVGKMGPPSQQYNFKKKYKELYDDLMNNDNIDQNATILFWSKMASVLNDTRMILPKSLALQKGVINTDVPAPHFDISKWKIYDLSEVISDRNELLNEYDFSELKDSPKLKKNLFERLMKIYQESDIPSYPLAQCTNFKWGSLIDKSILSIAPIGYYDLKPGSRNNSIFPIYQDKDNDDDNLDDLLRPNLAFRYQVNYRLGP